MDKELQAVDRRAATGRRNIAAAIDKEIEDEEGEVVKRLKSRWEERVEEAATARGLERGLEQGQQGLVLLQLERRCGPLDDMVQQRVRSLSGKQVAALGQDLLDFTGRADLDRWLAEHAPQ